MNSYCDLIEKHFPINENDWKELKDQILEKASLGSHVCIKIIHGSLPSVKKNDNIKVRAFIKTRRCHDDFIDIDNAQANVDFFHLLQYQPF